MLNWKHPQFAKSSHFLSLWSEAGQQPEFLSGNKLQDIKAQLLLSEETQTGVVSHQSKLLKTPEKVPAQNDDFELECSHSIKGSIPHG